MTDKKKTAGYATGGFEAELENQNDKAPSSPVSPNAQASSPAEAISPDAVATKYGAWIVIGFCDRTAKRAIVRCACGQVREVGVETLKSGESRGCGCRAPPRAKAAPSRPDSFASGIGEAEGCAARQRHRGGGSS